MVKYEEMYQYDNRVMFILELMEEIPLEKLIESQEEDVSEDSARWALYQVALGIQCMHSYNLLSRSIQSRYIRVNAAK